MIMMMIIIIIIIIKQICSTPYGSDADIRITNIIFLSDVCPSPNFLMQHDVSAAGCASVFRQGKLLIC
jgi:hypothetical protein